MEAVDRLPVCSLSVEELVGALVSKPDFRGIVFFDPNYSEQCGVPPTANFNWRSKNCDPLILTAEMVPHLARIPRGPTPPQEHQAD